MYIMQGIRYLEWEKKFGQISYKNREIRKNWEKKGKLGRKWKACPREREGLATPLVGRYLTSMDLYLGYILRIDLYKLVGDYLH